MTIESLINSSADQIVEGLETAILDRAETRLINFFAGGFQASLARRMMPHLKEFVGNVQIESDSRSSPRHVSLLGGDSDSSPVFNAEVDDV